MGGIMSATDICFPYVTNDMISFRKFFPPGETVIFDGQDYVCEDCDYGVDPASHGQPLHSMFSLFLSCIKSFIQRRLKIYSCVFRNIPGQCIHENHALTSRVKIEQIWQINFFVYHGRLNQSPQNF